MARYGKKAQEKVEKAMHERKRGTLRSGGSGKKVKSRKQAIAIGLSEARESASLSRGLDRFELWVRRRLWPGDAHSPR